jgi:t-SNARE complex subunit (syntaxin)
LHKANKDLEIAAKATSGGNNCICYGLIILVVIVVGVAVTFFWKK